MSVFWLFIGFIAGSLLPLFDGFLDFLASKINYDRKGKK